jgi:predicted nucleic acid-binding protein
MSGWPQSVWHNASFLKSPLRSYYSARPTVRQHGRRASMAGAPAWQARQHQQVTEFRELFAEQVLLIVPALEIFADQEAALRRSGRPIDDFDILIGSTAVAHGLTFVTRNTRHFSGLVNLPLENWIDNP